MRSATRLALACVLAVLAYAASPVLPRARGELPVSLSDAEFWRLSGSWSEPDGFFDSDNLVSNEDTFQRVIPQLSATVTKGGVYLGVGPDQNFAYILATEPRLAVITDIRRGNLREHLLYKALIELSSDRAEFLSRVFSRPRPATVRPGGPPEDLFRAFRAVAPSQALFDANLRAVLNHLTTDHHFGLAEGDAAGIEAIYAEFFHNGPDLRFVSSRGGSLYPSYEDVQLSTDDVGVNRGYLSTDDRFARLRAYELANAIVPVVGDFAGPHALRAVGAYVREHGSAVSVFYTSNVERYLFQNGLWPSFLANVAALPLTESSMFVRSCFDSCSSPGTSRAVSLLDSMPGLLADARAGRVATYPDVLRHSHSR